MDSENLIGADYQQERLDAYIAGYVDGEGSFHVAIQRNPHTKSGWQFVPEFHVSQNADRRQVLDLIAERFGCGRIQQNHRGTKDTTLVFVVRKRRDLIERVIPFFDSNPLLSTKEQDFLAFRSVVEAMERGEHLKIDGMEKLRTIALSMNGAGKYRRLHKPPESSETICRTPEGEDMVRPAWRHAESGGNDLIPD